MPYERTEIQRYESPKALKVDCPVCLIGRVYLRPRAGIQRRTCRNRSCEAPLRFRLTYCGGALTDGRTLRWQRWTIHGSQGR